MANGDHIYWDLHTWQGENAGQLSHPSVTVSELRDAESQLQPVFARIERGRQSNFDFSASVFGASNETAMKAAAGPQIVPVYGSDFRSVPVFFLQDDHDKHWENDAVTDDIASYLLKVSYPGSNSSSHAPPSSCTTPSSSSLLVPAGRAARTRESESGRAPCRR